MERFWANQFNTGGATRERATLCVPKTLNCLHRFSLTQEYGDDFRNTTSSSGSRWSLPKAALARIVHRRQSAPLLKYPHFLPPSSDDSAARTQNSETKISASSSLDLSEKLSAAILNSRQGTSKNAVVILSSTCFREEQWQAQRSSMVELRRQSPPLRVPSFP